MYTEHSAYSLSYVYRDVYITESVHTSVKEREQVRDRDSATEKER